MGANVPIPASVLEQYIETLVETSLQMKRKMYNISVKKQFLLKYHGNIGNIFEPYNEEFYRFFLQ